MSKDKEKCYLSLDWDKVFDAFSKHVGHTLKPTVSDSQVFIALIEQKINRVCEKLVHNKIANDTEQVRLDYENGYKNKVACIKALRTIHTDISLQEAIIILDKDNSYGL